MKKTTIVAAAVVTTAFVAGVFRPAGAVLLPGTGLESNIFAGVLALSLFLTVLLGLRGTALATLVNTESVLLFGWLFWAFASWVGDSSIGQADVAGVFRHSFLAAMTFVTCITLTVRAGSSSYAAGGALLAGLGLLGLGVLTGDLFALATDAEHRLGSSVSNANEWGYTFLLAICAGTLLLGRQDVSLWKRTFVTICVAAFAGCIVLTGSRKAFLGALFLLAGWVTLRGSLGGGVAKGLAWRAFGIGALFVVAFVVLEATFLGTRLAETSSLEAVVLREEERLGNYIQLLHVLADRPLAGVGLGQWVNVSWAGKASHSDYVSILGETGVVGGVLYFGMYLVLFARVLRTVKLAGGWNSPYGSEARSFLWVVATLLLVALGRWNYSTPLHYVILGCGVGSAIINGRSPRIRRVTRLHPGTASTRSCAIPESGVDLRPKTVRR